MQLTNSLLFCALTTFSRIPTVNTTSCLFKNIGFAVIFCKRLPTAAAFLSFMASLKYKIEIPFFIGATHQGSSHLVGFCKTGVLKNVAKSTGKHLWQNHFFNKVAVFSCATLLKRRVSDTGVFL